MSTPERIKLAGPAGAVSALVWDGPADRLPVLLLHPVNTGAAVWREVAPRLGRRVAAPDYRGHGSSDPGPRYLPADFAADALATLDHLGWQRAHLAGGSIGGAVAVELTALAGQQRIASIGAFGATIGVGLPESEVAPLVAELCELGAAGWFAAHGSELVGPDMPDSVVAALVELNEGRDAETVAEIVRTTFSLADARPAAATLTHPLPPAVVAVGTHDPTCPRPIADELAGYLAAEVVTLPGIGHLPMLEAPGQVADLLVALHTRAE